MNISAKAWHLRYMRFFLGNYYAPTNLCAYFWTLVLFLGPWSVVALLLRGMSAIDNALGRRYLRHQAENPSTVGEVSWYLVLMILGLIVVPIWSITLAYLWVFGKSESSKPEEPKAKGPKPPSILAAWIRAKKNRVCPLISISDEETTPYEDNVR